MRNRWLASCAMNRNVCLSVCSLRARGVRVRECVAYWHYVQSHLKVCVRCCVAVSAVRRICRSCLCELCAAGRRASHTACNAAAFVTCTHSRVVARLTGDSCSAMSLVDLSGLQQLQEGVKSGAALVYFWAPWCKPCADVQRVLEELARKHHPAVRVLRVEAEQQPEISEALGITVVPTFVAFQGGKETARIEGARIPDVVSLVTKLAASAAAPLAAAPASAAASESSGGDLKARLVKLMNYAPVMLFMKGTPAAPQCGFSRQAVELLTRNNVKFSSFNIIDHPDVRTGLKELNNWPTYPQLYAAGKLIGGLDVMKELEAEGEFVSSLPAGAIAGTGADATGGDLDATLRALTTRNPVILFMKGSPRSPR